MKNKTMKTVLFVLVVSVLFAFCVTATACDLGGGGKDKPATGKTVTGLDVTITKADLNVSGNVITVTKGTVLSLVKSDFTVTALYSDGSSKSVTQFDLDASELDGALAVGTYTVSITYNKQTLYVTVNVVDDASPTADYEILPELPTAEQMAITYTGSVIDAIEKADEIMGQSGASATLLQLIRDNKVVVAAEEDLDEGETRSATEPGAYYVSVLAADSRYGWQDVSNAGVATQITCRTLTWSIEKIVLTTPTIVRNTLPYNGSEQTVEIDFHGQNESLFTFVNGNVDTRKGTDVSSHIVTVQLAADAKAHYALRQVDDSLTSDAAIEVGTFAIVPAALPMPTIAGMQADENEFYHFTYTGEAILPQLTLGGEILQAEMNEMGQYVYSYGVEGVRVYIGVSDVEYVDALSGSNLSNTTYFHAINCEIDANAAGDHNYYWQNTPNFSEVTIKYVIDKAQTELPADFAENFKLKYVYSGTADVIANWNLQIAPNYYLTLLDTHNYTFGVTISVENSNYFLLTEDVKAYLQMNGIGIYENINLPTDEQGQSVGYQGNNLEFRWAENASFGQDNVAQVGTYHFDLVYKRGLNDENQYIENYEPIVVRDVEVEVIKGPKVFYQYNSPSVLRSDGITSTFYCQDEHGDPMTFTVRAYPYSNGSEVSIKSYRHTYSTTEDPTTFEETNVLMNAGYYKTYVQINYDSDRYFPVYDKGEGAYEVTDTLEYDWRVWKQQFGINDGYEPNRSIKNGTIEAYDPGAHYWVSGSGENPGYAVNVDFAFTQTFWYKATEEADYAQLFPVEGKYNLFPNGYYKYVVSNFVYDTVNYEMSSDESVSYEWTQTREHFFLMLSDDFKKATGKFDFRPYQNYHETLSWLPAVTVVGDVTVKYKEHEEDEYAILSTYANDAEEDYPVTTAGYYLVTAAIDYDDASYYYEVYGAMDTTYTVTYEFVIPAE